MVVPCTTKVAVGVVEPIPTLPPALTTKKEVPEEEATLNGSRVVEPWTLKLTVEEEALTPTTVPLSKMVEVARAEADVHLVT